MSDAALRRERGPGWVKPEEDQQTCRYCGSGMIDEGYGEYRCPNRLCRAYCEMHNGDDAWSEPRGRLFVIRLPAVGPSKLYIHLCNDEDDRPREDGNVRWNQHARDWFLEHGGEGLPVSYCPYCGEELEPPEEIDDNG